MILDTELTFIHPYYTTFQYTSYVINYNALRIPVISPHDDRLRLAYVLSPLPSVEGGGLDPYHQIGLRLQSSSYLTICTEIVRINH